MSTIPGNPVTVENYLSQPLVLGEPDISGPMAVYPVFGAPPSLGYISMARAHGPGLPVKEHRGGGSYRWRRSCR